MKWLVEGTEAAEPLAVTVVDDGHEAVQVTVDDHPMAFQLHSLGDDRYQVEHGGRVYIVDCVQANGGYVVLDTHHALDLKVVDERDTWLGVSGLDAGGGAIKAQMPGKIVAVDVQPGDTIAAGGRMLVIEAMKMENEVVSPCDAIVRSVSVNVGDAVESGGIMIVLEIPDSE